MKTCANPACEHDMKDRRSDALYCSAACRQADYRARRNALSAETPFPWRALRGIVRRRPAARQPSQSRNDT